MYIYAGVCVCVCVCRGVNEWGLNAILDWVLCVLRVFVTDWRAHRWRMMNIWISLHTLRADMTMVLKSTYDELISRKRIKFKQPWLTCAQDFGHYSRKGKKDLGWKEGKVCPICLSQEKNLSVIEGSFIFTVLIDTISLFLPPLPPLIHLNVAKLIVRNIHFTL